MSISSTLSLNGKNGEEETLEAIEKFRKFYEDKLKEIDVEGGGDTLELKLKVQERWIKDLTEQTEMMAKIVKELEEEATTRVKMLEDKLKQTSKVAYEVMKRYQTYNVTHNLDEPFQKVFYLENDLKNLLEFIRRIRDDSKWSIDGLQFYNVTYSDLFGKEQQPKDSIMVPISNKADSKQENSPKTETEKPMDFDEILKKKDEEYEHLRQEMLDMRNALTEEVACKHDMISALKKDVQQLEERCVQADKQTAFKDDIIKELRKEIKQLKQQLPYNVPFKQLKVNRSKTVFTTIRHSRNTEKPKYSTIILINENKSDKEKISKGEEKKRDSPKIELSKSECDLLNNSSYLKECPVKERSKFTVTNFNKTFRVPGPSSVDLTKDSFIS